MFKAMQSLLTRRKCIVDESDDCRAFWHSILNKWLRAFQNLHLFHEPPQAYLRTLESGLHATLEILFLRGIVCRRVIVDSGWDQRFV